jgi:lysozyme
MRPGTNIQFENGSVITPRPSQGNGMRPPQQRPGSPIDNRPGTRPTAQGPSLGNGTRPTAQGPSSGNGMRPTEQDLNPPSDNRPGTNFDFTEGSVITPRPSQANGNRPITTARPIITTPVTPPAGNRPITTARPIITTPVTLSNNPPGTSFAEPDIKQMIIGHEGSIAFPYKDSKGLWTIGVGHLIGDGKLLPPEFSAYKNNGGPNDKNNNKTPAMTQSQIQELFNKDYEKHKKIAMRTPGWELANDRGKAAMIDLAFNMGAWHEKEVDGKLEWKNTVAALERGDFEAAAEGLSNSRWYKQVKDRGPTIVEMIRSGKKN